MTNKDVFNVRRLTAHLAVKVEAARGQTTLPNDGTHDHGAIAEVHGELIRVPAQAGATSVRVDGAQVAVICYFVSIKDKNS